MVTHSSASRGPTVGLSFRWRLPDSAALTDEVYREGSGDHAWLAASQHPNIPAAVLRWGFASLSAVEQLTPALTRTRSIVKQRKSPELGVLRYDRRRCAGLRPLRPGVTSATGYLTYHGGRPLAQKPTVPPGLPSSMACGRVRETCSAPSRPDCFAITEAVIRLFGTSSFDVVQPDRPAALPTPSRSARTGEHHYPVRTDPSGSPAGGYERQRLACACPGSHTFTTELTQRTEGVAGMKEQVCAQHGYSPWRSRDATSTAR